MSESQTNQEKSSFDQLRQILDGLTIDQIRFIVARQEFSTDKEAAEEIGLKPDTIYQWKHKGHPIDDAVKLIAIDGLIVAQHLRRRNLAKAMAVKISGLDSEDERLRQGVATEVIEWEMGRATQKKELTGKDGGPIETKDVSLTDEERTNRVVAILDAARTKRDTTSS